ncbi:probable nicotinamidase [Thermococcus kodakarensis KOD1]|uniref:nicotinamidase n=1 Tax=Thermococcus kodakarensis (strain ATCC BAA-918 / JCM 12380 / KOD1) TaxID=69014 RepID=Q5JIT6_THEKO|nr:nicotinamidase [Thermococcus kodakarensis]WCN27580.1 nicotinamidase [Thermococcus kodakarensis]WCN29871.1 nicotinamidase [Thermococcus kodakarensis]BAD85839.1 probable nicotinamidase [Thermococcus kodakarensis KOD1]
MPKEALIVVDMQRDFMPGGALPVPEGDTIIPKCNEYIKKFKEKGALIVATRDWHPPNHISFKERGGPWPPHCVQNTPGAEFVVDLPEDAIIISKATEPDKEAYSGFEGTNLAEILRENGVEKVYICGVATEYCVKATALDAVRHGFETYLLSDAVKGINPEDEKKALEEMKRAGVKIL